MRGFSPHTKDSYERKAKEVIKYFKKPMKEVTMDKQINKKQLLYCNNSSEAGYYIGTLFF